MSGPIVRSGPSQTYTKNWANVFGGGKKQADAKGEKGKKPDTKKAKKKK